MRPCFYLEALPLFTRGLVGLPDSPALLRELRLLERLPGRVGKDQVSHPRNAHDDMANAVCGVLRSLANRLGFNTNYSEWIGGSSSEADDPDWWRRMQFGAYLRSLGMQG
jgi:hypothetical protein